MPLCDSRGMRDGDRRVELVEALLEVPIADGVKKRAIEVGVECPDHRAIRFLDRHHRQHRTERRVDVNDVVLPQTEDSLQILAQLESPRKSRLRSVGIDRLASADAHDVRLVARAGDVRRDDVDLMPISPRFAGKEVHVLADSAEVRIVILGNEGDSEGPCVLDARHRE